MIPILINFEPNDTLVLSTHITCTNTYTHTHTHTHTHTLPTITCTPSTHTSHPYLYLVLLLALAPLLMLSSSSTSVQCEYVARSDPQPDLHPLSHTQNDGCLASLNATHLQPSVWVGVTCTKFMPFHVWACVGMCGHVCNYKHWQIHLIPKQYHNQKP